MDAWPVNVDAWPDNPLASHWFRTYEAESTFSARVCAERDAALREVERLEYELGRWRQGTANMQVVA